MKKHIVKKLQLNRETLQDLAKVTAGGETRYSGCQGALCETGTACNISWCICD